MPKMRDPVDSFRDIQRHLSVGKSRVIKLETNRDRDWIITKIDEMALTIGTIISKLPEEDQSSSAKLISNELNLIKKELEKDVPKTDYRAAVRSMCNCTDMKQVYVIGKKYNMPPEEIDQIIREADPKTNLGRAYTALRAKQKPNGPPAVIQPQYNERSAPNVIMEDEDTNNSEVAAHSDEMGDDLKQLLEADE